MKKLETKSLTDIGASNDAFKNTVAAVNEESKVILKKLFTLTKHNIDYIITLAKELAQENGSAIVSASEALRKIVNEHEEENR